MSVVIWAAAVVVLLLHIGASVVDQNPNVVTLLVFAVVDVALYLGLVRRYGLWRRNGR